MAAVTIDYTEKLATGNERHAVYGSTPRRSGLLHKSRDKNGFPARAGLHDFNVRASRLRQRQLLPDDGAKRAVSHAGVEPSVDFRNFRGLRRP